MKNKGFTLVELLAVIMILGIIALIMTPIFRDVIKRNRTKAYEISAKEYIKEIETKLEKLELINPVNYTDCIVVSKTNKLTCGEDTIELNYEGNSPTSGTIKLDGLSVVSATLAFENDNIILFDGKNFQVGKNDEIYTITFDPMGGTISQTTKQISKGSTYGTLPIPTKPGYVFKGWRGKNLWSYNSYKTYVEISGDTYIFDATIVSGNTGGGTFSLQKYKDGTYLSVLYSTKKLGENEFAFTKDSTFNSLRLKLNGSKADTAIKVPIIELEDGKTYTFSFTIDSLSGLSATTRYIQIEEGSEATSYEPYIITPSTIFDNDKDVTLTAIWEAK